MATNALKIENFLRSSDGWYIVQEQDRFGHWENSFCFWSQNKSFAQITAAESVGSKPSRLRYSGFTRPF